LTSLTVAERERLLSDDFEPWMLWLHPDQKRVVDEDYDSPCILRGISGSGKTIILLHRARRLAHLYPDETIGILTLNRSLARLLENLLSKLCPEHERRTIKVEAFYDYFKAVISEIGCEQYLNEYMHDLPPNDPMQVALSQALDRHKDLANDFSPQNGETLDDTWFEFWRIDEDEMFALRDEVKRALGELQSFDVENYIRDEFTLIRSAFSRTERGKDRGEGTSYFEYPRHGRCIGFPVTVRRRILRLLRRYEEYMLAGAMMDELALTQAILPARRRLADLPPALRRRCLLVDEFQDLSTLDLSLLKQIPTQVENGLFLVGDTVQKVMVKDFTLSAANLDRTQTRSRVITKNYRNSRQILEAAHAMVSHYGELASKTGEAIEVLNPEFAVRETAPPRCIAADHPLDVAWRSAIDWLDGETRKPWSVCLVSANPHAITPETILHARPQGVSANRLSGDYILEPESMVVGTLAEVKGFEFSLILIVGCDASFLPDPRLPEDERWRDALRLYVAMTRGRDQVVLIHSGAPSPFIDLMRGHLNLEVDPYRYGGPRSVSTPKVAPKAPAPVAVDAPAVAAVQLPMELSTNARMALLFYYERHVFRGRRARNGQIQSAFNGWMETPRNLHQIRLSRLFPKDQVRRDLADEIDRYLRPHRCALVWDC
jgi:superfamily I DNA/RNA helicase